MQNQETYKRVHILPDGIDVFVAENTLISDALAKAGINISKPCAGRGTCGKCVVLLDGEPVKGCESIIVKDSEITVPDAIRLSGQQVLTDIRLYDAGKIVPQVEKIELKLEVPTFDDATDDLTRFINSLSEKLQIERKKIYVEPSVVRALPHVLRKNDFSVSPVFFHENDGVSVLTLHTNPDAPVYGIGIDIGTTTMVTSLCNLQTGESILNYGVPNPQAVCGADVISRIIYSEETEDGSEILRHSVAQALTHSIEYISEKAALSPEDIPIAVIAGNTVMTHFFTGIPTDYLRREPYVPAANVYPHMRPVELGIPILPHGRVLLLPSIASYVGGDITAGVIATKLSEKSGYSLLVDVGTNGEIVLAGEGFMMTCACSAGPAFEGSGISCGSRAVPGAIDNVYLENSEIKYEVLGDAEADSICGSGIISLMSVMLEAGVINRSGRFTEPREKFHVSEKVFITESDIQNLIRSKAAIFAGIKIMADSVGIALSDLDQIYIAGGFGRSINIPNAISIGMLPELDEGKYSYVGNSSLAGALMVLNDRTIDTPEVAAAITNLELSSDNRFMEEFTQACFLPHTDFSLFKNTL